MIHKLAILTTLLSTISLAQDKIESDLSTPQSCPQKECGVFFDLNLSFEIRAPIDGYIEDIAAPRSLRFGFVNPAFPERESFVLARAEKMGIGPDEARDVADPEFVNSASIEYARSTGLVGTEPSQWAVIIRARAFTAKKDEFDRRIETITAEIEYTERLMQYVEGNRRRAWDVVETEQEFQKWRLKQIPGANTDVDPIRAYIAMLGMARKWAHTVPDYQYGFAAEQLLREREQTEAARRNLLNLAALQNVPCPTTCVVIAQHAFAGQFVNKGDLLLTVRNAYPTGTD